MHTNSVVRSALSGVVLAAPFAILSVWLFCTIPGFGLGLVLQGILFAVVLAAVALSLSRSMGRWGVTLGLILYTVSLLLWFAASVSWFMQGSSFNERFFVHMDVDNARVSLEAYPWAFIGMFVALIVLLFAMGWLLRRASRRSMSRWMLLPVAALVGVLLVLNAPPRQLSAYLHHAQNNQHMAQSPAAARIRAMINPHPSRPAMVNATPGKNLVFVYLESVERTYTDPKRFPGLLPNIDQMRKQGLDFSGLQTFPGVTYTIAGIFSSQCGAPFLIDSIFGNDFGKLGFVPNNDDTSAHSFHPELACLGDVLHAAGYHQTYLSGVNLSFANTDVFFHMHGYDEALGKPEIEKLHDGKLPTEGWGLYDNDMFAQALSTYQEQEASGRPFSIVFSTIDTHPPDGYMLPGCTAYRPIRNAMLDAVHCTDTLLGKFIDRLRREPGWKNTVVVVMSDHVAMRNVASPLYPPDDQRQPLLFMINAGQGDRPARMYHMGIAPTLLARMNVHSNVRFMAGADRGEPDSTGTELPADDLAQAVLRQALWERQTPPTLCAKGDLIRWNEDKSIDIGGWNLPFMVGGYRRKNIDDNQTLLVFSDQRNAQLQMLFTGESEPWLAKARAQNRSVFLARPFWTSDGSRRLALDWVSPGGAWASLGSVSDMRAVALHSSKCSALLTELDQAPAGTRLDFSANFGTTTIPASSEQRMGFVRSAAIPAKASPMAHTSFMLARLVAKDAAGHTPHITQGDRISLYPASGRKPWMDFDVTGLSSVSLVPRINALTGGCLRRTDTGIVDVTISVDGRAAPPFIVDRHYTETVAVDTAGARRMRVLVGEHGIPDCDYFSMGFTNIHDTGTGAETAPGNTATTH